MECLTARVLGNWPTLLNNIYGYKFTVDVPIPRDAVWTNTFNTIMQRAAEDMMREMDRQIIDELLGVKKSAKRR